MTKCLTKAAQGRTGLLMLLFEVQSIMAEKAWQKGTRQWVTLFPQLGSKRDECWYSAHFLHVTESRTPAPRMVPPIVRVGLPKSIRFVSMVILNLLKLMINIHQD